MQESENKNAIPKGLYRAGVGICLLNRSKKIWIGQRTDTPSLLPGAPAWQMPQGGIDGGESAREAALREVLEETGSGKVEILARAPQTLSYDLPEEIIGRVLKGYVGQKQTWFVMRFMGEDEDFNIAAQRNPEFCAWEWCDPLSLLPRVVPFKRPLYENVLQIFARFL